MGRALHIPRRVGELADALGVSGVALLEGLARVGWMTISGVDLTEIDLDLARRVGTIVLAFGDNIAGAVASIERLLRDEKADSSRATVMAHIALGYALARTRKRNRKRAQNGAERNRTAPHFADIAADAEALVFETFGS